MVTSDLEALRLSRDELQKFLHKHPDAALDMLTVMGRRLRQNVELLRHTASRNVNEEIKDLRTIVQRVGSDLPFDFCADQSEPTGRKRSCPFRY